MEVNDELIDKLVALAKLEFKGEEKKEIRQDMDRIMHLIDELNDVDTEGVEPLVYLTDEVQRLRPDSVEKSLDKAEALQKAPQKDSDYFKVPKVLNK